MHHKRHCDETNNGCEQAKLRDGFDVSEELFSPHVKA